MHWKVFLAAMNIGLWFWRHNGVAPLLRVGLCCEMMANMA